MYKCCLVSNRNKTTQLPCEDSIILDKMLFFGIIFIKNNITFFNTPDLYASNVQIIAKRVGAKNIAPTLYFSRP